MSGGRQYSDAVLDSMQVAYGEGFLSPGAAEETRALLQGLPVRNATCLDFGSGVGGAALLVVEELGAARVVGVDVEPAAVQRAQGAGLKRGLAGAVEFRAIVPESTLPFEAAGFDLAYSKDVVCHVQCKREVFAELGRVLKPGATLNIADWTLGTAPGGRAPFEAWLTQLEDYGLVFHYETLSAYVDALREAGFESVHTTAHSATSIRVARAQLESATGTARARSALTLGARGHEQRTALTRARLTALEAGGVEHWLIRASRSDPDAGQGQ